MSISALSGVAVFRFSIFGGNENIICPRLFGRKIESAIEIAKQHQIVPQATLQSSTAELLHFSCAHTQENFLRLFSSFQVRLRRVLRFFYGADAILRMKILLQVEKARRLYRFQIEHGRWNSV